MTVADQDWQEAGARIDALIAAMKGVGLTEKVRIDAATLTVQVELWPRRPADLGDEDRQGGR